MANLANKAGQAIRCLIAKCNPAYRSPRISDIALSTVCNDQFLPGTLVMLYSMRKHLPSFNALSIRLFCDNSISLFSNNNRQLLRNLYPNLTIEDVDVELYRNARCSVQAHRPAYLTLETFRMHDVRRAVFFDGDMLTLGDFTDALTTRYPFFGVRTGTFSLKRGLHKWSYINSGFFGITLNSTIRKHYSGLLEVVRNRDDERADLLDQETINRYFGQRKQIIYLYNHLYNFRDFGAGGNGSEKLFLHYEKDIRILHFSGYSARPKPWEWPEVVAKGLEHHAAYARWLTYARDCASSSEAAKCIFQQSGLPFN